MTGLTKAPVSVIKNQTELEQSPRTKHQTVLITDSILRHVKAKDSLGINHDLHQINKRDSTGLLHEDVRQFILKIRPDNVYVHLGVNDVNQGIPLIDTLKNFLRFKKFIDSQFCTKLIISLPIFTSNPETNRKIDEMRRALDGFVDNFTERYPPQPLKIRKIWINPNKNFEKNGDIVWDYYGVDGIHLTERGKQVILGNFRHHIHQCYKINPNPERSNEATQHQPLPKTIPQPTRMTLEDRSGRISTSYQQRGR